MSSLLRFPYLNIIHLRIASLSEELGLTNAVGTVKTVEALVYFVFMSLLEAKGVWCQVDTGRLVGHQTGLLQ